jgi:hypothetical protein
MLLVRDIIGCDRWMMTSKIIVSKTAESFSGNAYLTCSETNSVVPASSSHLPMNNSPRNGFRGFFSFPNFSLRLAYCCFRVLKNHFKTNNARFLGSFSRAGATKIEGCSAQYDENSVNEVEERMKGGAVNEDKSPEKDAIDFKKALQDPLFCADTPAPSFSLDDIAVLRCVWGNMGFQVGGCTVLFNDRLSL